MPAMQQSHVGNMPFSTPNAKTALGLSSQAEFREATTQKNSNGKLAESILNQEAKTSKLANEEVDDIGMSEEDAAL